MGGPSNDVNSRTRRGTKTRAGHVVTVASVVVGAVIVVVLLVIVLLSLFGLIVIIIVMMEFGVARRWGSFVCFALREVGHCLLERKLSCLQ